MRFGAEGFQGLLPSPPGISHEGVKCDSHQLCQKNHPWRGNDIYMGIMVGQGSCPRRAAVPLSPPHTVSGSCSWQRQIPSTHNRKSQKALFA